MTKEKESKEFKERKKIIELQEKADLKKHNLKMEELKFQRESDISHHQRELERQRIKSAEIQKSQIRRLDLSRGYRD